MGKMWNIIQVFTILLTLCRIISAEEPSFRILAPMFICGKSKPEGTTENRTDPAIPQQITIGLQTKGGQKLQYRVTIMFTLPGFVSQRHTLQLWKSVRQLEQRLEKERDAISASNQITISNDDLVAGVIYTFNIVAVGEAGSQNFTITYRGRNAQTSVVQDGSSASEDVSLILLGAEVCYADVPYVLTAKLIFCEPRNDYKLMWNIEGFDHRSMNTESTVLQIPPGVMVPGSVHNINVAVVEASNANEIVKATMKIAVLDRPLKGNIYPIYATVGFAQTTEVRVAFYNPHDEKVTWKCKDSVNGNCTENLIQSENLVRTSFLKETKFEISATVDQLSLESNIQVNPKSTISVTLQKLPPLYLIPGYRYEIAANVAGLVPKCSSNWTLVNAKGLAYFYIGDLGSIFINDIEENFLSELVDYGNDTIEREVRLTIPKEAPNWGGLASNALYKFRLVTECPEPIDDSVENKQRGTVTSHWDMILETNGPPKGLALTVSPEENGTALSTFYKFSTGIANDSATDYPLKYSYWYEADGNTVQIGEYYEVMSTETQLPYSENNISVFYVVCDSRQACSRVDGPQLKVQANPSIDLSEVKFRLDSIQQAFDRGNYQETTKIAFETFLTLKNQASAIYEDTYSRYIKILESQIASMKMAFIQQSGYITTNNVIQFAMQAKVLVDFNHGSNDRLLDQLLELIDSVERSSSRKKRAADPKPILTEGSVGKADPVSAKLEIYKSRVLSPNANIDYSHQLLEYIPHAVGEYCEDNAGYTTKDGWLVLETKKIQPTEKNLLSSADLIPHENSRVSLKSAEPAKVKQKLVDTSFLCLGKVIYGSDFLTMPRTNSSKGMYQVILVVFEKNGVNQTATWEDGKYIWNITIGGNDTNYQCQTWTTKMNWSSKSCNSSNYGSYVICECSKLNYLRIINSNEIISETPATVPPTSTTEPAKQSTIPPVEPVTTTTTETDMLTFSSELQSTATSPPLEIPSPSTSTAQPTTISAVATSPTPVPASQSPTPRPQTNSTVPPAVNTTHEPAAIALNSTRTTRTVSSGTLGYSIVGALALCGVLTVASFVLYRRRRNTTSLVDELQNIATRVRTQSLPVRYARFQDEHNMGGDNVSTISDTVTV